MKKFTVYYAEGCSREFYNEEDCLREEERMKELILLREESSPAKKLEALKADLQNCMYIPRGTICTCSFDSLMIKAMVRTCQEFAEKNKQYLTYY